MASPPEKTAPAVEVVVVVVAGAAARTLSVADALSVPAPVWSEVVTPVVSLNEPGA